MERTREWAQAASLAGALAVAFAACASGESSSREGAGPATTSERRLAPRPVAADTLTVYAASDLALAFADLAAQFDSTRGIAIRLVLGSTGNLARQVEQGAPADIFFAANESYVQALQERGLVEPGSQRRYARGHLVLATARTAGLSVHSLHDLMRPEVRRVAIANPAHAPYGLAARQALEALGLWTAVQPKLVYGENIRHALQFVQSGAADAGIVARSVAGVPDIAYVPIDEALHRPIEQAAAVVTRSPRAAQARLFLDFVTGPEGRATLIAHGFTVPDHKGLLTDSLGSATTAPGADSAHARVAARPAGARAAR